MPRRYDDWGYFPPSTPREAKGGIKARSKRGEFSSTWWGKRWIAVLESLRLEGRLARGRSYARRGQVVALHVDGGIVTAKVQGSRPNPYAVAIEIKKISASDWRKVGRALSENMAIAAKLVAGEMPPAIEPIFAAAGPSLFPAKASELITSCSCPDWSNPCKHVAAVYYLLAEEFERDPFLLLQLRGMRREEFVRLLGKQSAPAADAARPNEAPADASPEPQPLTKDVARFWSGAPMPDDIFDSVTSPASPAPLARRLGPFPFWRGDEDFLEAVAQLCQRAADRGMRAYLGGEIKQTPPTGDGSAAEPEPRPSDPPIRRSAAGDRGRVASPFRPVRQRRPPSGA